MRPKFVSGDASRIISLVECGAADKDWSSQTSLDGHQICIDKRFHTRIASIEETNLGIRRRHSKSSRLLAIHVKLLIGGTYGKNRIVRAQPHLVAVQEAFLSPGSSTFCESEQKPMRSITFPESLRKFLIALSLTNIEFRRAHCTS